MKAAVVQAAPVWLNPKATTAKIISLMKEAAENQAQICVFGETFLSGYPAWVEFTGGAVFDDPLQKKAYAMYLASAVRADGPEIRAIAQKAAQLGIFIYLGVQELSNSTGTVYCSLAAIDPDQGLVSMHRKLMPTYEERLVWGIGDGNGLRVHQFKNIRIGGLNCWENWMPLARTALYAQGEQVHVSVWPGSPRLTKDITRFVAQEGRVYVLAAGGLLYDKDIPDNFPFKDEMIKNPGFHRTGGSVIVSPEGKILGHAEEGKECIIYADLDMEKVGQARQNFDPTGHYSRPDVLKLTVNSQRLMPIKWEKEKT
ncbi:carbon-nitrogen hydrolase family protein [Dethiosulfatarculus sandiegensis]|uniref:Nitrilase n=1 Tax=Dethiosulfatarculus sandiegensis TaxID=1429043 RepID=A0A0D2JC34_9BACT|nr:carbon-nitrogen hydrolase family protein [Dethiosulfatarculus sandiegensis]KIX13331.1 nitrilase [Dethiosulfatarculus sandiegensis]